MIEVNCPKGCGKCCKVITMTGQSKLNWRKQDAEWSLKHLKRIRKKDAIKIRPILAKVSWKGLQYYKCNLFDYKTNKCKDYKRRPYMCRYFPFYHEVVLNVKHFKSLPDCYFKHQIMLRSK